MAMGEIRRKMVYVDSMGFTALSVEDCKAVSVPGLTITDAYLQLTKDKPFFGHIIGFGTLPWINEPSNEVRFDFRVHDPNICGPHLSNEMVDSCYYYEIPERAESRHNRCVLQFSSFWEGSGEK